MTIGDDPKPWVIRDHVDDEGLQKDLGLNTNGVQDYLIGREGDRILIEVNGGNIPVGKNTATITVPDDKPCPNKCTGGPQ